MPKTTNINLNLTDDANTYFEDWQKSIDGTGESNMVIIDREIGEIKQTIGYIANILDIVNGEVL